MAEIVHIVDDNASIRATTSYVLADHGYATRTYESGEEFLRNVDSEDGCVLLDLRMPEMSGIEVLEEMARRASALPVIMVTGHGDVMAAVRALKLGAIDLIQKPYIETDLLDAIERALAAIERDKRRLEERRAADERVRRLSERERQVLRGLLAGMTNKEMARRLGLSPRTVEMHRSNMMSDLQVSAAADAIRIAIDADLEPLETLGPQRLAPVARADFEAPDMRPREPGAWPAPAKLQQILPSVIDVLEGSTDGVLLLDRQMHITYANRNALETIGEGRELVGLGLWTAFPGASQTPARDQFLRAAQQRIPASFDLHSPGLGRWFNLSVRPISSGLQVSFRPLTARGQLMLL